MPSPGRIWAAQLGGTVAIALAIYLFFRFQGIEPTPTPESFWGRYGVYALIAACVPALYYLRTFKRALDAWAAATRKAGAGNASLQVDLLRKLSIGGALCELPMALGVLQLLSGGEMRLFIGGAFFAVAMRLSYRPFVRA
jgi:hypothetical protein